ncbi:hypothetical protein LOTGIDRAFT_135457 [Lottia gigantea]|uniref:Alpha-mannosidase n=1 Tax=Lottia gigantea TaxID=225164 RepID=V3YVL3_LOTGI|nr:hypothetical protein LOTGIDRAFT_135457 [Lottia gigantea]ESO82023.1 hypothetical protein LOTGIDRAFT_135457 [Lottia gigantea]
MFFIIFQKCNPVKEGMLNIHIIPHSHDDVGWLKTMDQYYSGQGQSYYHGGECVQCILNTVIPSLLKNPTRRFIYVEMSFFSKWYYAQNKQMKEDVKKLIRERRLEFIVGGWCMSDAATTYYNDIIDQHTIGFDFILKEFGKCAMPRVGWHIDQFGHSREHSSIFAQMGFDALFLGRIDDQDHEYRIKNHNMETVWRASPKNLGDVASLFTSVLYDFYFAPSGMYLEGFPPSYLQPELSCDFDFFFLHFQSQGFKTQHVLIPFGGDFAFRNAENYIGSLEKIIETVNNMQASGSKVHALFSTPTCYVNYVNQAGTKFQAKEDDFFPYSIIPASHWTGYFVSRAGLKLHVKHASSFLQVRKTIEISYTVPIRLIWFFNIWEAVAVLQHHDAITGTEKQHVTDDYNLMLSRGETACQVPYGRLMALGGSPMQLPQQQYCPGLNMSVCDFTENMDKGVITLFNPLAQQINYWVRLPIKTDSVGVTCPEGNKIQTQVVPLSSVTTTIPERGNSQAKNELVFKAIVPPVGFASYYMEASSGRCKYIRLQGSVKAALIDTFHMSFTIDKLTGKLSTVSNDEFNIHAKVDQEYLYYIGDVGQPRNPSVHTLYGNHRRASGAYTFVPKLNTPPEPVRGKSSVKYTVTKGKNVQEVHQQYNPWTSQVIRLYDDAKYLEIEWTVGPIDVDDRQGREIVSHFATDLNTKSLFYTDSNGREMLERKRNYRATWPLNVTDKVSGNYYPITNKIFIRDAEKNIQLTVINDRSQGGGSIQDGAFEIMVHRRLLHDDDLGVVEPLNEKGIDGKGLIYRGKYSVKLPSIFTLEPPVFSSGKHYLLLEKIGDVNNNYRSMGLQWSGLRESLPSNVHLLTLDQVYNGGNVKLLIRLENFYEVDENNLSNKKAEVSLQRLFVPFDIKEVHEVSLGASFRISDIKRLQWTTEDGRVTPSEIGKYETILR